MDKFIYQNKYSIPSPLCDEIIQKFEETEDKRDGSTLGGVQKKIKDTKDYNIPHSDSSDSKWFKIEKFLYKELFANVKKYVEHINIPNYKPELNCGQDSSILKNTELHTDSFMIQRYEKGVGKYVYHNDYDMEYDAKRYRVITFLWYLNTVEEGGETEFWGNFKIKPEKGKLVLFPAAWPFPHRGIMPISSNKYIITGWLYVEHNV